MDYRQHDNCLRQSPQCGSLKATFTKTSEARVSPPAKHFSFTSAHRAPKCVLKSFDPSVKSGHLSDPRSPIPAYGKPSKLAAEQFILAVTDNSNLLTECNVCHKLASVQLGHCISGSHTDVAPGTQLLPCPADLVVTPFVIQSSYPTNDE